MQDCITKTLEKEALSDIDKSPFTGVMIDEIVKVTVEKKMIIFLWYTKDGEACTTFCGNHTVAAGDAETVYEKVKEVLEEKKIDLQKVIW